MRAPQAHGGKGGGDVSGHALDFFLGVGMRGVSQEFDPAAGIVVAHDAVEYNDSTRFRGGNVGGGDGLSADVGADKAEISAHECLPAG